MKGLPVPAITLFLTFGAVATITLLCAYWLYGHQTSFRSCRQPCGILSTQDRRVYIKLLKHVHAGFKNGNSFPRFTSVVMAVTDLDTVSYVALSYTWKRHIAMRSTSPLCRQILLDGSLLAVEENLWDFLTSDPGAEVMKSHQLLFIDAICINQSVNLERERQIPLIPVVYENATRIVVWLGKDGRACPHNPARSTQIGATSLNELDPCVLRFVAHNLYWTRLFVVPELILAGNVLICVNDEVVEWDGMQDIDALSQLLRQKCPTPNAYQPMIKILEFKRAWDQTRHCFNSTRTKHAQGFLLFDALQIAAQLHCKYPRDRINAMLPLTRNCPIRADYGHIRTNFNLCKDVLQYGMKELYEEGRSEEQMRDAAAFLVGFCQPLLSGHDQVRAAQLVRQTLNSLYA
ncbi:uncharacterized protein B0I36DRAFT_309115 [Microdochium trichocladiopsis]|uniref:Heterokaryon incompatibility domain-containing protein n=1 Tax=Microdochium trichocladiopsis TaxID=1682393 RepID=A0A9P8YGS6_9PEZI|nr:uncharacterized protein B0I36DRAFT_309115 [Microdochium trichocladiopsis]KAH7039698.1 hypothetical protein B0I36DRAFT_309115 [Microdochium trichocladiopsis]